MNPIDILTKRGLKLEDLTPQEQESYFELVERANKTQITIPMLQEYIEKARYSVADELSKIEETPNSWLSILCLFIPLIGIIRKWYMDERRLGLTARLKNYILLESLLLAPEKAKRAMEQGISALSGKK